MRHDGLPQRPRSLRQRAFCIAFLLPFVLVLVLALPACRITAACNGALTACQTAPVCNGALASSPAPDLTATGGVVYAAANGSVSALRAGTGALAWHSPDGGGVTGRPTSPVVADSIVIASTGPGALIARRLSDGALAWHSQPVPRPRNGYNPPLPVLAIADDVVYAAASPDSIAAWRVADGSLLWQSPSLALPADPAYASSYPPLPEPVVAAGIVYFSAGKSVHAVSAAEGSLLWSSPALQLWSFYTPPVLADGRLFIVAHDGSLYALRADGGAVLWHTPNPDAASLPDASFPPPPVVRDGIVYYAAVNGVRALAADTGRLLWQLPSTYPDAGPAPVISGGVAYVATSGTNSTGARFSPDTLWALDAQTGAVRWRVAIQPAVGAPFFVNGAALYTMSPSKVAAWSASGGTSLWQRTVQSGPASLQQVIFAGGAFYLSTSGSYTCGGNPVPPAVSALRAADGALLWHASVPVP